MMHGQTNIRNIKRKSFVIRYIGVFGLGRSSVKVGMSAGQQSKPSCFVHINWVIF